MFGARQSAPVVVIFLKFSEVGQVVQEGCCCAFELRKILTERELQY